jgi:hypothetical protein
MLNNAQMMIIHITSSLTVIFTNTTNNATIRKKGVVIMSKSYFEKVGIDRQYESSTAQEAEKAFKYSCKCCCTTGKHQECDRCQIAFVHDFMMTYFNSKHQTA